MQKQKPSIAKTAFYGARYATLAHSWIGSLTYAVALFRCCNLQASSKTPRDKVATLCAIVADSLAHERCTSCGPG